MAHPLEWGRAKEKPPAPNANSGSAPPVPKKLGKLGSFLMDFKAILADKYEKLTLLIKLFVYGGIIAGFMGGILYASGQVTAEMPFLWLSIILGALLVIVRKDLTFNLKFFLLQKLRRNPRVVYHIDGSKVITRMVLSYNPPTSTIKMGGKPPLEIEVTPDALLTDSSYSVPAGVHIGSEKNLKNLYKEAGDYFTAKQVDLMIKDAEQLGELKSTEKLDNLLKIAYIVAGAAVVGVVFSILTWSAVGDLTAAWQSVAPLLRQIPEVLKNRLV